MDLTESYIKDANQLHWAVKGFLIPEHSQEKDIIAIHESYFARLWGNHEAFNHLDGFEEAWAERQLKNGMGNVNSSSGS